MIALMPIRPSLPGADFRPHHCNWLCALTGHGAPAPHKAVEVRRVVPKHPNGIGRRVKPGKINLAAIVKSGSMRSRLGSRLL